MRMLRLSGLDGDDMTDDQRDAFVNMAENLGIEPGEAEDLVDLYLEEIEKHAAPPPSKPVVIAAPNGPVAVQQCCRRGSPRRAEDSDADRRRGRAGKVSQFCEQHRH